MTLKQLLGFLIMILGLFFVYFGIMMQDLSSGGSSLIDFSSVTNMGLLFALFGLVCVFWDAGADRILGRRKSKIQLALTREKARDYDAAIVMWEELGEIDEAARVRKLRADEGSVKITQKVVKGDEITKTEIKDSVISKSSIGAGGKSKSEELRDAKALLDDGIIDDDEFKQMKKEILGK